MATRQDFSAWAVSLFLNMYDGTELEDVCNTCGGVRMPAGYRYFPEISESVWGTDVPLDGSAGGDRCGNIIYYTLYINNCTFKYAIIHIRRIFFFSTLAGSAVDDTHDRHLMMYLYLCLEAFFLCVLRDGWWYMASL